MVLLICLAFLGQSMASIVMPYHMMNMAGMDTQEQSHKLTMMDHSDHSMTSDDVSTEQSSNDCCAKTCNCFAGGCSNLAVLLKDVNKDVIDIFSFKIHSISNLVKSQQPTSLYRPPIQS